ncbi:leptin [Hyla sarda]|uniref:leptin n=1 Tax=Hyla sarda TaxID=327740 RepID=UPI0024C29B26|nr:leptin [Hyla sarda]XP_056425290.1 leptin [Hyla sarda]
MQYILLSLCGLLWMRLHLCHGKAIRTDRIKADAKLLSDILITRIQGHPIQLNYPSSLKSTGLDFIPDEEQFVSLEKMDETLEIFQNILSSIPMEDVDQMLSDLETLRKLLQDLNCTMDGAARESRLTNSLEYFRKEHKKASYTVEKVTLDRLEKTLDNIIKHLDYITNC